MVNRLVFIKLKNQMDADLVMHEMKRVIPTLPGVKFTSVGRVKGRDDYDISLSIHFDTMHDVETFGPDTAHRHFVDSFLKPLVSAITAFNIEIE